MLDPEERGEGKDALVQYLKRNNALIANRQNDAPLIALFDWDITDQQLAQARSAYGARGSDYVLRMDVTHAEGRLGKDFHGIERFYPPRIVREAHEAGEMAVSFPKKGAYSVSKAELKRGKLLLLERLLKTSDPAELAPLARVLSDIDTAARQAQAEQRTLFEAGMSGVT
jgi:hypothetical protein